VPQVRVRIAWKTPDGIWGISMVPCRLWDLHDNSGLFAKRSSPCRTPIAQRRGKPPTPIPVAVRTVVIFLFLAAAISFLTGSSLLFPGLFTTTTSARLKSAFAEACLRNAFDAARQGGVIVLRTRDAVNRRTAERSIRITTARWSKVIICFNKNGCTRISDTAIYAKRALRGPLLDRESDRFVLAPPNHRDDEAALTSGPLSLLQ
jgi:hypothetical protein